MAGPVVAVMQPYFYPHMGYYRLMACADIFVIFDCVQFPRRGRVHRTEVPGRKGQTEWLTLPLKRADRRAVIKAIQLSSQAKAIMQERLANHEWYHTANGPLAAWIKRNLQEPGDSLAALLTRQLAFVRDQLGFRCELIHSSQLELEAELRGQDRVLAIARRLGASTYINAPGGKHLYSDEAFKESGVSLQFLSAYSGQHQHGMKALASEAPEVLRQDVLSSIDIEAGERGSPIDL